MRELSEFLTDREIYVYQNHPQLSYARIGAELGITGNRVAQIKHTVLRKIREEKRDEARRIRAEQIMLLPLKRLEWSVIMRALQCYEDKLTPSNVRTRTNPNYDPDPDIARCQKIRSYIAEVMSGK